MPIQYRIDPDSGVIFRRFTGDITLQDFEQHWRSLLEDPALQEPLAMIVDMRECRLLVHGDELSSLIVNVIEPRLGRRRWFSAVVVAAPVQYGITKQFIAYSHGCGITDVFYDMEEAVEWIRAAILP
jgi:hypothetical protein